MIQTVKENNNNNYLVDGRIIVPKKEDNRHYIEVLKWLSEGNVIEPFETEYERKVRYAKETVGAIQNLLDAKAIESGYYHILSACSYAASDNPFQEEGKAFVSWRGNVWAHAYQILADVESGVIEEPTLEEILSGLPVF